MSGKNCFYPYLNNTEVNNDLKRAQESKLDANQESSKAKPLPITISRKVSNVSKMTNKSNK